MRIRIKITLLLAASLLLVMLLFNIVTYFTVVRITTNSQIQLLWNAIQPLMSQTELYHPARWVRTSWLKPFLMPQAMIRIIDKDSVIQTQITTNEKLKEIPAYFSNRSLAKTLNTSEALIVYIQTPIIDDKNVTLGAVQIVRKLDTLEQYLSVLIKVLMLTTMGSVIFALACGMYYAKIILRPIHQLAFVMESNQRNGVFKKLELAPSKHQDELGQLIHTFNSMIGKLEHNFNLQKQFLADASHELKTPLTIIESYADLLRRWGGSNKEVRTEAVEAIHSEATRLRKLTHALLTVANTESGEHMLWEAFVLSELVTTTAVTLQQAFHRELRCELDTALEGVTMSGSPGQIKQLLIILLDNAIKYSQGAVLVTLQPDPRDAQIAVLQVTDRGIGIEPADLPRLFDRFYRVDKARSRSTGGSGLGLSIAYNIVRLHKGTIVIDSKPGEGTRVTVKLPLNAAPPCR
ncbi:HAMP domain-containing protein [Paenibacillus sp. LMG 31456]|uniref:histidine kinase n=1 Tax=Paenibacillus foliorum TaxID=2654974 RepID=A0A972GQC2_9BACL|nr:HAMP domain-containing sensor histidine kinase [Paenibacillus foliorum]NOU94961.1 HAMP domain-containing protein [Paenibacillus foliorum]